MTLFSDKLMWRFHRGAIDEIECLHGSPNMCHVSCVPFRVDFHGTLVGGDWNMAKYFPHQIENFIIPTDFHIFQRGKYTNHQPVCIYMYIYIYICMEHHHFQWVNPLFRLGHFPVRYVTESSIHWSFRIFHSMVPDLEDHEKNPRQSRNWD